MVERDEMRKYNRGACTMLYVHMCIMDYLLHVLSYLN